jgi:hypothetical protein
MKKLVLSSCVLVLLVFALTQKVAANTEPAPKKGTDGPVFKWTATTFDFGQIKVGIPVSHEFTFTNSGTVPLIISSVQASCGCTVAEYTKDPILPGAKGLVKATFNAASVGQFNKTVTVNSNTEGEAVQLTFKGEVVE